MALNPWVGKIPWRRKTTSVSLPGESHGQKSLAGYSPKGHKGLDMTKQLNDYAPHMWLLRGCSLGHAHSHGGWQLYHQDSLWMSLSLVVRCCSVAQLCLTLCDPMDCSTLGFSVLHYLPEFAQIHVHWINDATNHLFFCHPFLLLPSIFPSIRVFYNESALCLRWPESWSFSISPSDEYLGLISKRIDWFDLLAVRETLQHHSSKSSILHCLPLIVSAVPLRLC